MSDATNFGKQAAGGLWANIRAKKQRGGQAAKPGDKDYPDAKNWKKVTAISAEKSAAKPCSCGCGDTVTTCKCSNSCSCRKSGGSCYKEEKAAANAFGALGAMAGKAFKGFTGAANPAAKAVGNTSNAAAVPRAVPKMPAPPMPAPPKPLAPKPLAPKPPAATPAATPATPPKLTPTEMAEMKRMNDAGLGYTLPTSRAPVVTRATQQNADSAMRARLNAGGGTPQELQQVMGPQFREFAARRAGAGNPSPAMPPPPPPRLPVKSGAANFGRKVANRVDFYERAPKDETKKKLPDHESFNNALMRAEAAGEKPSAELFNSSDSEYKEKAKKEAKSKCVPCDSGMYKNYDRGVYQTGPMQAMDADEAISKANGGVEATEETEHAEKDIHNSGQKSAYAFGWKVAYDLENLTGNVAPSSSRPVRSNLLDQMPAKMSPYASEYAPGQAPSRMPPVGGQKLDLVPEKLTLLASLLNAGRSAASSAGNAISSGASAVNNARLSAGKAIGEGAYAASTLGPELFTGPDKPGMTPFPRGTKPAAPKADAPKADAPKADAPKADAPKADAPSAMAGLADLPWGAIGGAGLGAAGLSALAYHLMSKKKKKKQDGSDEEG